MAPGEPVTPPRPAGPPGPDTPVQFLKGAGPGRARLLERLGVRTIGDLLFHFPRDYADRTRLSTVADAPIGSVATLLGEVRRVETPRRAGRQDTIVTLDDGTGLIHAIWFGQPFMQRQFTPGQRVMLSGEVGFYDRKRLNNPEWEVLTDEEVDSLNVGRLAPIYPGTAGLSQRMIRRLVRAGLDATLPLLKETLPESIRREENLIGRREALATVHFPEDAATLAAARQRLIFEEALGLQLVLRWIRLERQTVRPGIAFPRDSALARGIEADLPFRLTPDQAAALEEILTDMADSRPMGRLLQGDVGSGKTVVALLAAAHAVEAGYQVAFMAPTESLADQHHATLTRLAGPRGVSVARLTGSTRGRERKAVLAAVADGTAQIVVGTHALIQESVLFHALGLVVVDEQHRFGVYQRAELKSKGRTPDVLTMTATPIPRTLYLTRVADLSISTIRHRPVGHGEIVTRVTGEANREKVYGVLVREIEKGRQVFIVYPLVEESEKLDLKAATQMAADLAVHPLFVRHRVGLLHGRMKSPEKSAVLEAFRAGEIQLLVTTTVVEVGIDIPNATVMVVEHPDRFGLSQLHQLRGRVGRGTARSYCLLIESGAGGPAHERLALFERTDDGFALAEADLKFRGAGAILGVRQHGPSGTSLLIADPERDQEVLERAFARADRLARENPELLGEEWSALRRLVGEGMAQGRRFLDAG